MQNVVEPARKVPVVEEADVVVLGGGTAGFVAALAAARNGARTTLIEKWGYVGGAAVGGMVVTIPERTGVWGIEREFHERLAPRGGVARVRVGTPDPWANLSPADCKILADEMLIEAGVTVLFHSLFVDVTRSGSRLDAAIIENKSGRQAVCGRIFVDATGDGDVAARAGVPFTLGDGNGRFTDVTTMYMIAGADADKIFAAKPWDQKLPGRVSGVVATAVHPRELNAWGGSLHGNGVDVRDLTRLEMQLRAQIREEFANMKRLWPGMEDAYISGLAEQMGVRETRHVHTDCMVTKADITAKRVFEDSIGRCWEFTAPYRCLCPLGLDNLLLSGRCVGAESAACGPLRIVPNCCTTGQAAGTAAAMAVKGDADVRSVNVKSLQDTLKAQGVELGV